MIRSLVRQREILWFAISALGRRKRRNASVLAVYALVVGFMATALIFPESLRRDSTALLADEPEIIVQRVMAGRQEPVPASYIEPVRSIRGIQAVEGRLWGHLMPEGTGRLLTVVVPKEFPYPAGSAALGREVEAGESILLRSHTGEILPLTVAGRIGHASGQVSKGLVSIDEAAFRRWTGLREGFYTDLAVKARNKRELATIAEKIAKLFPDSRPLIRPEMQRTYDSIFNWRGGLVIALMLVPMMAFIIFAWDKAAGMSDDERREIGILKALGWETSEVISLKCWEGGLLSFIAFACGIILAEALLPAAGAYFIGPALKGWSVMYPDVSFRTAFGPYQAVTLFFLTVAPYMVITIVPSWRAAVIDPDTVMRG